MLDYYVDVLQSVSRGCATTGSAKTPAILLAAFATTLCLMPFLLPEEPVASKDESKPVPALVDGKEGANRVLEKSKQLTRQ